MELKPLRRALVPAGAPHPLLPRSPPQTQAELWRASRLSGSAARIFKQNTREIGQRPGLDRDPGPA